MKEGFFGAQEDPSAEPRAHLILFTSKRRMMTSVHRRAADGRFFAYSKGACRELLEKCSSALSGGRAVPLAQGAREATLCQMDDFTSQGYRVIGLAERELPRAAREKAPEEVESGMTFVGRAALADPPRPRVKEALAEAQRGGIRIVMMTGDHELTARTIAHRLGVVSMPDPRVVTGHELAKMSREDLKSALGHRDVVFARILLEQKLGIVQALMAQGEIVGVTGDRVNDAPALLEANVGIAMGVGGTDVAR